MHGIPNNSSSPDPDIRRVLDALRALVRELRLASVAAEKRHGLNSAQLFVLHVLRSRGDLSLGEVAEATFTDQSSVSVVVRKLEARGLVVKEVTEADRRKLRLGLSPDGHRLLAQTPAPVQDALVRRLEALGAGKLAQLAGLLETLTPPASGAPPMFFEEPGGRRGKGGVHGRS